MCNVYSFKFLILNLTYVNLLRILFLRVKKLIFLSKPSGVFRSVYKADYQLNGLWITLIQYGYHMCYNFKNVHQ